MFHGGNGFFRRHEFEQLARQAFAGRQGCHAAAGPQHRRTVRQHLDLIHAVRDEQDGFAFGAKAAQQLEQAVAILDVERRCGLVEDQQAPGAQQRTGDTDQLPVGKRQRPRRLLDIEPSQAKLMERPADEFLTGPLGLVPFAPLANVRPPELPEVIDRMRGRIDTQPDRPLAAKLWTASSLLMGLRYEQPLIDNLLSGVRQMEESVVYQAILNRGVQQGTQQGAVSEARKLLLLSAQAKFGPPGAAIGAAINAITDLARLEALVPRVHTVSSWDELLKSE